MSASVRNHWEEIKEFGAILKEKKIVAEYLLCLFFPLYALRQSTGSVSTFIVSSRGEVLLSHLMFIKAPSTPDMLETL